MVPGYNKDLSTNSFTPLVSGSICVLSAINCPNVASVWKENRKTGALYCTVLMLTLASTRNITMEGKWRPMDWRYRSYGLEPKPQCFFKPDNVVFLPQTKLILCDEGPKESLQVDLFRHHCFGNGVKCHDPFFVSILFMFLVFLRCEIREVKNSIWFRMFTLENNCLLLFSSKKLTYFLKMYLELLRRTSSAFYDQNTKKVFAGRWDNALTVFIPWVYFTALLLGF